MRAASLPLLLGLLPGLLGACASAPSPSLAPARAHPPAADTPPSDAKDPPSAPAPAASATASSPAPVTAGDVDPADLRAANAFTSNLYARVKRTPGNIMISATSLRTALGVALLGARGETARQMAHALEYPADLAKVAVLGKAETAAWTDARGSTELVVANRLWTDKSFPLKEDFTKAATDAFAVGVEPVDFTSAPADARRAINAWVSEKTASKIPEVLPEGAVEKSTRVVVTNAIYFKARWSSPFQKAATKDEAFTTGAKTAAVVKVPTMHETGNHLFAQVGAVKVLGLRYDQAQLSMMVVLPADTAAFAKLEESLSAETFDAWNKALASQRVNVSLPRFAFQWGAPMEAALQDLGMRDAFSGKADFKGISEATGPKLQLSRVVQKTWVSVDENGTEAAAASGIAMSVTSAQMGPIAEFKADHPFLFFVYDAKRGRILFAGRVVDPR